MARTGVVILVMLAMVLLYLALFRTVTESLHGKPRTYTAAQRAEGLHCVDQLLDWPHAMQTALKQRLDTADAIDIESIRPGPLQPDNTHKLTVFYRILRIGEVVPDANKATGTLVNADCTFSLTTIER